MHKKIRLLIASIFVLGCLCATAHADAGDQPQSPWTLRNFRGAFIDAYQPQVTGGNSASLYLGWFPEYRLTEKFGFTGKGGFTLFSSNGPAVFMMLDFAVYASYNFAGSFSVEAGGGIQSWIAAAGTSGEVGANVVWKCPNRILKYVDRFWVGYDYAALPNFPAHEILAGFGVSF